MHLAIRTLSLASLQSWEFNWALHQSSHDLATLFHCFATKTKALMREIPPATQATETKETNISNKHNIALKDPIGQDYTDTSSINHLAMLPPACRVELCLFCCALLCCALMCFELLCCCIVLYFVELCFFLLFCFVFSFVLLLFVCVLVVTIKWQVHVC